jgi:hypothetical protein
MEIPFDVFKVLLTSSHEAQEKILDELGFDVMSDCDEYSGKLINEENWLKPTPEVLRNYFERTCDDPDKRMEIYERETSLSNDKLEKFKDYLITEALENEYHPGIFTGYLHCGDDSLIVIAERTGGYGDCEVTFVGIYEDFESAINKIGGPTGHLI